MEAKYEKLKNDILFEQNQIDKVIEKIKEIKDETAEIDKAALATFLMNFYNGIENIMKRCAKEYYKKMPIGEDWHKKLLQQSCVYNKNKVSIFDKETTDKLYAYLTFRHLFIHGYWFKLNQDKMKLLLDNITDLWQKIKNQLAEFIENI